MEVISTENIMGNASLMFYHLQNIFTVIISFGSQNGLWWRQRFWFYCEEAMVSRGLVIGQEQGQMVKATLIEHASMPLNFKSSAISLALSFSIGAMLHNLSLSPLLLQQLNSRQCFNLY